MSMFQNWSHGYPVSQSYPPSWHAFQSPAHLRLVCALMGVAWDVDASTPLSICEVGCGTGYTAQVLAAGNPQAQVLGLDYNPAHIAEARSLAAAAGLDNVRFIDADLADLTDADVDLLPEFDLITVHGVWSWVSDEVREGVLRLMRRRLKAGGLALVTYNALPGSAGALGLSRLVRNCLEGARNPDEGLAAAGNIVKALTAANAAHLPRTAWRQMLTGEIPGTREGYLVHEFSTTHWRPSFHADVAAAMATTRCDYVGSATLDENFPTLSLEPAQREMWESAPDAAARELLFDLCVGRPFRRDLYVRGLRRTPPDPGVERIWLTLADVSPGERILLTQLGEARLPPAVIDAAMSALARGPQTIASLRAQPGCEKVTPSELLALLVGSQAAVPLWRTPLDAPASPEDLQKARRFNAVAAERLAPFGLALGQYALASPVLAGGLKVSAMGLAVARLIAEWPKTEPGTLPSPQALWEKLRPPGATPDPQEQEGVVAALDHILKGQVPAWKALGIV